MKLQANELRIGNWINDPLLKREVRVDGIEPNWDYLWLNYKNGSGQYKSMIKDIEPIPLTEEWLEKLGFEFYDYDVFDKDEDGDMKAIYTAFRIKNGTTEYRVDIQPDEKHSFNIKWLWSEEVVLSSVLYVHTLQNLFFALTGKELTERK